MKSRQSLTILNEKDTSPEIIEYLKNPPTKDELSAILALLDMQPIELIRKGEKLFKESFKGKTLSNEEWIQVMVDNPILIERPIIIRGDKAIIGRPPERVNELF